MSLVLITLVLEVSESLTDHLNCYNFICRAKTDSVLTVDRCSTYIFWLVFEHLVGSPQLEQLQTSGPHHEIARAHHNNNIYPDLGGTIIATLSPRLKLFPLFLSPLLPRSHPNRTLTGIGPSPSREHPHQLPPPIGAFVTPTQPVAAIVAHTSGLGEHLRQDSQSGNL